MKNINKILIITFALLFLFTINYTASASTTNYLDFSLEKVVELGDYKILSIKVVNNSSSDYSFGWVNSCELVITTTEETVTKSISSGKILSGSDKIYDYTIKYNGKIKSITYKDIRKLNSNGLPINTGVNQYDSYDISVDIASYDLIFGKTILIFGCIILVVLIILILILNKKKGGKIVRKVGGLINVGAICILIYAGYCFVVKPDMESADFMDVARKYWFLWILGIVLLGIGNSLRGKKGSTKRNRNGYYDNNEQFRMNQQMHEEQTRLFNEQVQRDIQQQQQQQFENFNNQSNGMF